MKTQNKFFAAVALVAICVLLAFAPKKKVIVIDTGHGGKDFGAVVDGHSEKAIVREIAHQIAQNALGEDVEINIVGAEDEFKDLSERVRGINSLKPEVLISLHLSSSPDLSRSGANAYVSEKNKHYEKSQQLARKLLQSLDAEKTEVKQQDLFVIRNVECAAVTLEVGFLSNAADRAKLTSKAGQAEIAEKVGKAISDR